MLSTCRGRVHLRSRNDKDLGGKYPDVVKALASLPDETVIDGELIAMDDAGHPSFNALQNYGASKSPLLYYVFDVLTIRGHDVTGEPLSSRREFLDQEILPKLPDPIRPSAVLDASLPDLIRAVKEQGLEGLVAKRKNSRYESGQRSGAWQKMRVNQGQEFVIGGYTRAPRAFDALIFGYYQDGHLLYGANAERFHASITRAAVQAVLRSGDAQMPVRESTREAEREVGTGAHGGENGRMCLAHAVAGRPIRVSRMDSGRSPSSQSFCWAPARQETHRCGSGV
jgi:bifunctional non-homologous end joining protein LigD